MRFDPRLVFLSRRLEENISKCFPGAGVKVLDVGCADGSFIHAARETLGRRVSAVDGVDVPGNWLKSSAADVVDSAGRLYVHDLQKGIGSMRPNTYQAATLFEVIEHVENVHALLKNLRRLLVPGGLVMLTTPNLMGLSRFVKGDTWVGVRETDHKYLFDPLSITMVLERAGYGEVRARGFYFPSAPPALDTVNKVLSRVPGGGMILATARKL